MLRRTLLALLGVAIVGCNRRRTEKKAEKTKSKPKASDDIPEHDIVSRYKKTGDEWASVVVDAGISEKELSRLAQHLHDEEPDVRFRFFGDDDKKQIRALEDWDKNYGTPASAKFPRPKAWQAKHMRGATTPDLRGTWELIAYDGASDGYGEAIAQLE